MRILGVIAAMLPLLFAGAARAEVPMDGYFVARQACPAFQSIRNQTNPGGILTELDRAYRIVAVNRTEATHYWIVVPGVSPERRWVAVGCGIRTVDAGGEVPAEPGEPAEPAPGTETQYILGVSWQPAFCEGHAGKPECESQTANRFDASHFTLHGLWPQPRTNIYCDVSDDDERNSDEGRWTELPPVTLGAALRAALDEVMPGTQSSLERHEWTKHGSCYETDAEEYFADAVAMMSALNGSAVAQLFATNVGRQLTLQEVRAAFDQSFGAGAGERVRIACDKDGGRRLIGELTIGLTGSIAAPADFAPLILAARPTDGGCTAGTVDPVGLQ